MKLNLQPIDCELREYGTVITTEDSRRMMTEFTDLNIDSFDDISFINVK